MDSAVKRSLSSRSAERLQRLHQSGPSHPHRVRALVLTPTRELAAQVGDSVATYGAHLPLKSTVVFGGVKINPQIDRLRVVTNLANEFGGYCSVSNTMITAFFGGSDPNPWADDGC